MNHHSFAHSVERTCGWTAAEWLAEEALFHRLEVNWARLGNHVEQAYAHARRWECLSRALAAPPRKA